MLATQTVVASMERIEQELRVVRQRFCDEVQNLWKSIQNGVHPENLSEDPPVNTLLCRAASMDSLGSRD